MLKEFITSTHVGSWQMYKGNNKVENHALFFIFSNGTNPIKNMTTHECCFLFSDLFNKQLRNSEYFKQLFQGANAELWFVYLYVFIKKLQDMQLLDHSSITSLSQRGTKMRRAQSVPLIGLFLASIWHQPEAANKWFTPTDSCTKSNSFPVPSNLYSNGLGLLGAI
jgi:hypothetical protein